MSEFEYHFEWDENKAATNLIKHGVTFSLATHAVRDPLAVPLFDGDHSTLDEPRWITIGRAPNGTCLVVAHTWKDMDAKSARIRIISARKATQREQAEYEESI